MSCAIDTNVLIDLVAGSSGSAADTAALLEREGRLGALVVSPPVYAECLAHPGWRQRDVDSLLRETRIGVSWDLARHVWIRAGVRFAAYAARRRRSREGSPRRILADFLIGAHAVDVGALITYDDFFTANFPELRVIGAY